MDPDNKPAEEPKRSQKYVSLILEIIKIAIVAFIIVAPIRYFLFQPFIVSGSSMAPNFESGDYLIVNEISYRFSAPERGDVIVFNAGFINGYAGQRFIKRVIGLPGETVDVTNGQVKILKDGKTTVLSEKYLPADLKTLKDVNIILKADQYFVLGDNREYSFDSRYWGMVPKQDIIGKAALRIFPLTTLSEISRPVY
jgi:signal peptidase I